MLGGVEVTDLAAELAGVAQGGLFQAGGNLQAVRREVLEGDTVDPEVTLQALGRSQAAQGAA